MNAGFMWPPERGMVTRRKRKPTTKTANATVRFGSDPLDSKHEMTEPVSANIMVAVATSSVIAPLHISSEKYSW